MLYIFMGQSCTGKSTVAETIKKSLDVEIFTGKDYYRLATNEADAWNLFHQKLTTVANKHITEENIIYIITEVSQLEKIQQIANAIFVKFDSPMEIIKQRFAQRMKGNLPAAVEAMLHLQNETWKAVKADYMVDTTKDQGLLIDTLPYVTF